MNPIVRVGNLLSIEYNLPLELAQGIALHAAMTAAICVEAKHRAERLLDGYHTIWSFVSQALENPRIIHAAEKAITDTVTALANETKAQERQT